jgi:hypothetical protein
MQIASFGNISWVIDATQIINLQDLSTSYELESDANEGDRLKPQTVSLKTNYIRTSGCPDLTSVIRMWKDAVGTIAPLDISGWNNPIVTSNLKLKKVDVSDIKMDVNGSPVMCSISASFEEAETGSTSEVVTESEDLAQQSYVSALEVEPSESEKEEWKPQGWDDIDPQYEGLYEAW